MAKPADRTWSVLVMDMSRTGAPEAERIVPGFASHTDAFDYAEARTRASIEELRGSNASPADILRLWQMYGEDCLVLGDQRTTSLVELYIAVPASREECEWKSRTPRPRRFHVELIASGDTGDRLRLSGIVNRFLEPSLDTLAAIFASRARERMTLPGLSDPSPGRFQLLNLFELFAPPLPVPTEPGDLRRWKVQVDFVSGDLKLHSEASGVFEWPEKPQGPFLEAMRRVLIGDALASRGWGPDRVAECDVLAGSVTETAEPADHPIYFDETPVPAGSHA